MEKQEVKVMQKILRANERVAEELRDEFAARGIFFLNLMSSPGSGKTTLLQATGLESDMQLAVIEGDVETALDAERLAEAGIRVLQINTGPFGGDCHLEASWVRDAARQLDLDGIDVLCVENIGNLICPACFDLGTHINAVMLSVTEGEDKPLKYPLAFRTSQFCIISKTDLLPHVDVTIERLRANVHSVNPDMHIIEISARTGEGVDTWLDWLRSQVAAHR
ncbi:MAG: hydrogenase nickel incorporation protein HypB [Candidatus Cloacimonetes bacterium]|nr:hydrogenase nickel incorporation protein HypB [Candidatus Cloacimonadota bacterium]